MEYIKREEQYYEMESEGQYMFTCDCLDENNGTNSDESNEGSYGNLYSEQTTCSNLNNNVGNIKQEQQQEQLSLNDVLPIKISQLTIRRLTWQDFRGEPNYDEIWNAHIYWHINYYYTVDFIQGMHKKIKYKIQLTTEVKLKTNKNYVKNKCQLLLEHEQGHYVIGCLCALEFEKRIHTFKFTDNYKNEVQKIFLQTLQEYVQWEKKYDKETNHRLNTKKQNSWETNLISKIFNYRDYFLEQAKKRK